MMTRHIWMPCIIGLMTMGMSSCAIVRFSKPCDHTTIKTERQAEAMSKSMDPHDHRDSHVYIWLIADTLHTGLVFEYDWLLESGFIPPSDFPDARYVTLSWGDRTAYVQRRLMNIREIFHALFWPSESVMELIPANWHVTEVCPNQRIWQKRLPREQGRHLATFLNHCSVFDDAERPIVIGPSSWGNGVLLQSRHRYFYPRVCNIWTVQAMESMGERMNPWTAVSASGVIRQATKRENRYAQIWWGSVNADEPQPKDPDGGRQVRQ